MLAVLHCDSEQCLLSSTLKSMQLVVLIFVVAASTIFLTECSGYKYQTILSADKNLSLEWNVDYNKHIVKFRLKGKLMSNDWLAFGFSDYGEPVDADLILYWRDFGGYFHFKDAHTNREGKVYYDIEQNYVKTRDTKHQNGWFLLEFYRKFDTCDMDDYTIDNGTTHILFFTGSGFPRSINASSYEIGLQRVQLLKPDVPQLQMPDDVLIVDVTNPEITVPAQETTYWWYVTKLPDFKRKHHIIKYEGIIQKGHEHLVHHMEVFHCEVQRSKKIPHYNGPGMAEGKPPGLNVCRKVIGAWAMGATAVTLPQEAGTPVGGDNWSQYILLEVHYNNPHLLQGTKDSSGIRLYITNRLRKYDSAIMELGLEYTDKMAIPPRQSIFPLKGYCIPECTEVGIPIHGINIYASQLHTHLTGKRVYTKHVRNGKELPELNRDNHYSPHFQEIRTLPLPVNILPGDSLITVCEDSTLDRENITLGGFSIQEEMCVNYAHYYPAVELEVCKSSVDSGALDIFFEFMNRRLDENTSPYKSVASNYQSINWSLHTSYLLKLFYDLAPLSMQCNKSDGSRFEGNWERLAIPMILEPIRKDDHYC